MKTLIHKPYQFFFLAIPVLILIGLLSDGAVLDINIYDTYYVIAYIHLTLLFAILFGIIGLVYWIFEKVNLKLSNWLTMAHLGLTFGGGLVVFVLSQIYREESLGFEFNFLMSSTIALTLMTIGLGQLIFPINIICGMFKRKVKTSG